jgi:hypothetical protein
MADEARQAAVNPWKILRHAKVYRPVMSGNARKLFGFEVAVR